MKSSPTHMTKVVFRTFNDSGRMVSNSGFLKSQCAEVGSPRERLGSRRGCGGGSWPTCLCPEGSSQAWHRAGAPTIKGGRSFPRIESERPPTLDIPWSPQTTYAPPRSSSLRLGDRRRPSGSLRGCERCARQEQLRDGGRSSSTFSGMEARGGGEIVPVCVTLICDRAERAKYRRASSTETGGERL
jgi:hypothetical protein